ncbi:MAG: hypothetical protein HYY01_06850 [Chloroflexi bacterium]|nr:hypothetical protein [Chloroflexota bacterium]
MKNRWLRIGLLVVALMVGISGGAALAQGSDTGSDSPVKSFAARVAAILGLDEAQVQSALKQASREMQDEALQQKLDRMVEQGRLTQEQADQMKQWYQARPEGVSSGFPFGGRGFRGGMMGPGRGGHGMGGWKLSPPVSTPTPSTSGGTSF